MEIYLKFMLFIVFFLFCLSLARSQCVIPDPSPSLELFADELPRLPAIYLSQSYPLTMGAYKITQKLHRDLPNTTLYAFGTSQSSATYPGPVLVARRGVAARVRWENHIKDSTHFLSLDKSLHWANPKYGGVPTVTHLHGAEVLSVSDGQPDAWFTATGETGPVWQTQNYYYPNTQFPAMLWYHDHTLGITRLNIYAGLIGAYLITTVEEQNYNLPSGKFYLPLVLQDKVFYANGSLNSPIRWCPESFGDTIVVNGKVSPYMAVEPTSYRFRILNAAGARFFTLFFNFTGLAFWKIGSDGGYLNQSAILSNITLAPAERVDVVVDFTNIPNGTEIILQNNASVPFPLGSPPASMDAMVMKFQVVSTTSSRSSSRPTKTFNLPTKYSSSSRVVEVQEATITRRMTLMEIEDKDGNPSEVLLNNKTWTDRTTEMPRRGSTEIWELINLTDDAHPIHIHLVQVRALNHQGFDVVGFQNGSCSIRLDYGDSESCFTQEALDPSLDQIGWKDTIVAMPGEVTRMYINFIGQDGYGLPYDSRYNNTYLWHCHIADHEDNDMMRPYKLT